MNHVIFQLAQGPTGGSPTGPGNMSVMLWVIIAVVALVGFFLFIFLLQFLSLYIQAMTSNAHVGMLDMVGMKLRKVDIRTVVINRIRAVKSGMDMEPVPVTDTRKEGYVDRWIVYGKLFAEDHQHGEQLFTAKEMTVEPGVRNLYVSECAEPHGLFYAPDPSSQSICSIGALMPCSSRNSSTACWQPFHRK